MGNFIKTMRDINETMREPSNIFVGNIYPTRPHGDMVVMCDWDDEFPIYTVFVLSGINRGIIKTIRERDIITQKGRNLDKEDYYIHYRINDITGNKTYEEFTNKKNLLNM
jgi:hypothetical protein